jgi:hypothetical protein
LVLVVVIVVGLAGCGGSTEIDRSSPTTRPPAPSTTSVRARQLYEVTTTVLQDGRHGPQLCLGGVLDSLPPQCGGPDVVGLDWTTVPWASRGGKTTWASMHVIGTFDGHRFTLTHAPERPRPSTEPAQHVHFPQICAHPAGQSPPPEDQFVRVSGLDRFPGVISLWITDPGTLPPTSRYVVNIYVRPGYAASVTQAVRKEYGAGLCVVEKDAPSLAQLRAVQAEVQALGNQSPLGVTVTDFVDTTRAVVHVDVAVAGAPEVRFAREKFGALVELHGELRPIR